MRVFIPFIFLIILFSCNQKHRENSINLQQPKVVEAKGYVVPKDSIQPPVVIKIDESKLKKIPVGKPRIVYEYENVKNFKTPVLRRAGLPTINVAGKNGLGFPKYYPAIGNSIMAGMPEVLKAKDAQIKDPNPHSFSSFSKLQGLKQGVVRCVYQDKHGNMWFGTDGGACKYDGQSFIHYTENEGLCSNRLWSILQDSKGNYWFGTASGLCRFDGYNFTHFTEKEGFTNTGIYTIKEDKLGNVWFATQGNGVFRFNGNTFTHFTENEGLAHNMVFTVFEDHFGNIWFGTEGGIDKLTINNTLKKEEFTFCRYTVNEGLSANEIYAIEEDEHGNLWLGTNGSGICKITIENRDDYSKYFFSFYTEKEGLSNGEIYAIAKDRNNDLWFGTYGGGLTKLSMSAVSSKRNNMTTSNLNETFIIYNEKVGLSSNIIYSIFQDNTGTLWFGTGGGGACQYNGDKFSHISTNDGLSYNTVYVMIPDSNNNIWLGTNGGGVTIYTPKNNTEVGGCFTYLTQKEGLPNNFIASGLRDHDGNLWFGTVGGGVCKLSFDQKKGFEGAYFTHYTINDGLVSNTIVSMLEDRKGNIWFGSNGAGVSKYIPPKNRNDHKSQIIQFTKKQGLSNNTVYTIFEDNAGNIWLCTNGGLNKLSISENNKYKITQFLGKDGLPSNHISSIFQDKSENLWVCTNGGGISLFCRQHKNDDKLYTIYNIAENKGLENLYTLAIYQDSREHFYFGTRNGLEQLSKSNADKLTIKTTQLTDNSDAVFFKHFGYDDGFYGIGVNRGKTIFEDKYGDLWICANDRLTVLHPNALLPNRVAPNLQLNAIKLFNEPIAWPLISTRQDSVINLKNGIKVAGYAFDSISRWYGLPMNLRLTYNNNYLTFNFIGITMNQPKKVKYRYKLEGMDENWSGLTSRNEATYGNIPPGTYTFLVKAMNSDGYWSKPFAYTFTIRPPWWKTWWAYSAYAILILGSIFSYTRWRERTLRARQKELEVKVDEATEVIRKQKDEVEHQKEKVEEKNREILDSIEYAKRIQTAILPPPRVVKEFLKNSFILYIPKDIVAGDFYWMENVDDTIYFASCDCTGHGVPGAMVSVVCNTALNRAVNEFGLRKTGEIFDKTRELVLENFAKSDEEVKDGMDASLAALNLINKKMMWSGANNPLWIYRKNNIQIEEIKADKQPIGQSDKPKPFATTNIDLCAGDIIYLFTDGYSDQFGGEKNKKLTKAKFRELLLSLASLSMDEQRAKLLDFHNTYRGSNEQVDDICVMGVRV